LTKPELNNNEKLSTEQENPPIANLLLYAISDVIGFRYKGGRFVKCEILRIDPKGILVKLNTDYIGKNEKWYAGEDKYFNKAEMKRVSKQ
jgi:hypothetical protein